MSKKSISFGNLKKKSSAKKAVKTYPEHISDKETKEAVDAVVEAAQAIKDHNADKSAATAVIREKVFQDGIVNLQKGSQSTVVKGNDGTEVLLTFTGRFSKTEPENVKEFKGRFASKPVLSVSVEELGDNAQAFIDKLIDLANEMEVSEAIEVNEAYLPSGDVQELVDGLSPEEAVTLDSVYKIPSMIKIR